MTEQIEGTVAYAQVSYEADWLPCLENVKAANGHVDWVIVMEADSAPFKPEHRKALEDAGAIVKTAHWGDNFPAFRNASLNEARAYGASWILISDSDEHFNHELFRDLKPKIIPRLVEKGFNMAGIRCFDAFDAIEWWDDLDQLKELPGGTARESTWYKNLLFRLYPDLNYEGVGKKTKHTYTCSSCGHEEVETK